MNWCPVRPLKSRAIRILLAAWSVVNFSPYALAQQAGGSSFVRGDANVVIPRAVANSLANSGVLDIAQETILANGETLEIGDITVEAVAMYNLTADRLGFHPKGRGNSYVIDLAGTRAYVSGDTEDIPEMRALENIAVALICMNLPFTMTPDQAASAVLEFAPKVVYPYHYRGQNPERFKALVAARSEEIEVRVRNWYP